MLKGHGGNIYELAHELNCLPDDIIDMSSNVNPLGPPSELVKFLEKSLSSINFLPEVDSKSLIQAFADCYCFNFNKIIVGNGTTQIIYTLPVALQIKKAVIFGPAYSDYADACIMHGIKPDFIIARDSDNFKPDFDQLNKLKCVDTVFICNPNNPTGAFIPVPELTALCAAHPNINFVIDESYLPFMNDYEKASIMHTELPNVLVLHSLSKIFRIPGLRIGFLTGSEKLIKRLKKFTLPWSVNSLAQKAGEYLFVHSAQSKAFIEECSEIIKKERNRLINNLKNSIVLTPFKSVTSFVLIKLANGLNADTLCHTLAKQRILIRNCANFKGLSDNFIRISLKKPEINDLVVKKLLKVILL
ncbi:threonine-phosphate decarboxylase [Candidatus Magnetomoraceae bacterium gMMP-15]